MMFYKLDSFGSLSFHYDSKKKLVELYVFVRKGNNIYFSQCVSNRIICHWCLLCVLYGCQVMGPIGEFSPLRVIKISNKYLVLQKTSCFTCKFNVMSLLDVVANMSIILWTSIFFIFFCHVVNVVVGYCYYVLLFGAVQRSHNHWLSGFFIMKTSNFNCIFNYQKTTVSIWTWFMVFVELSFWIVCVIQQISCLTISI